MKSLTGAIAVAILLLMLLPANNSSSQTLPDNKLYPAKDTPNNITAGDTAKQSQSELCPALLELPLMFGRSAPCTRNYKLD
jgi:hypothetical protein